jgi:F-type H+-transporting ATPase subunit b
MQFEIGTMLYQLVAFIVLTLLVGKFAVRPILATMQKRQDHIQEQLDTAEQNRVEAEKLLEEQKVVLDKARVEAKEIVDRAKRQKEQEAEEIIGQAKNRAQQLVEDAASEIASEKEKALLALRNEVGVLSIQLTSKLLEKEVRDDEQSKLVDRYLEQVGRVQ